MLVSRMSVCHLYVIYFHMKGDEFEDGVPVKECEVCQVCFGFLEASEGMCVCLEA